MVNLADSIIRGENITKVQFSGDSKLEQVSMHMREIRLDDYYPIERRADFVLVDSKGNNFDFILTLHGINNAKVFIKRIKGVGDN